MARPFSARIDVEGLRAQQSVLAQTLKSRLGGVWTFTVSPTGRRGSIANTLIAKVQAGRERDPFYLNKRALETVRFALNGLTSTVDSVRKAAEKQVQDAMLTSIGENFQAQKNPSGSKFTPLTPEYAKRKQRALGFTLPILKATGDLLGGLVARVERRLS